MEAITTRSKDATGLEAIATSSKEMASLYPLVLGCGCPRHELPSTSFWHAKITTKDSVHLCDVYKPLICLALVHLPGICCKHKPFTILSSDNKKYTFNLKLEDRLLMKQCHGVTNNAQVVPSFSKALAETHSKTAGPKNPEQIFNPISTYI